MKPEARRASVWVGAQVAAAPPLSPEQVHRLTRALSGVLNPVDRCGTDTPATLEALGRTQ